MADDPFLALVPGILNHGVGVEHELAVESLQAILIVNVEWVVLGVFAGRLHDSAAAQGFTPSNLFLTGASLPLGYLLRIDQAVVVAVTDAGIDADPGR